MNAPCASGLPYPILPYPTLPNLPYPDHDPLTLGQGQEQEAELEPISTRHHFLPKGTKDEFRTTIARSRSPPPLLSSAPSSLPLSGKKTLSEPLPYYLPTSTSLFSRLLSFGCVLFYPRGCSLFNFCEFFGASICALYCLCVLDPEWMRKNHLPCGFWGFVWDLPCVVRMRWSATNIKLPRHLRNKGCLLRASNNTSIQRLHCNRQSWQAGLLFDVGAARQIVSADLGRGYEWTI